MRIIRGVILFLCLVFLNIPAFSQLLPRTINFSKSDYQAHNQNWMIAQAPDHKMYFGNTEGLLEFNGINWNLFQLPDKQAIRSVVCDDYGLIYTGAFGELGYWHKNNSSTLEYHSLVDSTILDEVEKEEIWHILKGKDYVLFQSFSSIFIYEDHKVTHLLPPGNIMYAFEVGGQLLVQVIDSGIYKFDKTGQFELLPATLSLSDKKVTGILPFEQNSFLVCTENDGVFLYEKDQLALWNNEAQEDFKSAQINKVLALSNGNYAFGTILDGLYILDGNGRIVRKINQQTALQNNTVLALFEDDRKNLWCGLDKGIDLLELNTPVKYFSDKTGREGTVYAACIFQDNMYLGTNQGLFVKKWADVQGFSQESDFQIIKGSQGQVWGLEIIDDQLICGHNEGTFLVDGNKFERISQITGGFSTIRHPERSDILIQGTYTGLIVLKKNGSGRWEFSHRITGFMEPVKQLQYLEDDFIWVANPIQGLHLLELTPDLQQVKTVKSFSAEHGLESNFNIDITTKEDQLIFKSGDRYYQYIEDGSTFIPYQDALFEDDGFKFREFGKDLSFRIFKNKVEYYYKGEKKLIDLTLVPRYETIIEIKPGLFLFSLDDGFAVMDKTELNNPVPFANPVIYVVENFGRRKTVELMAPFADREFFTSSQNDLRFHFYHTVYSHTPGLSYQLEGYDTIWYDTEGRSIKEFTNLPAGDYVFRIRSNELGTTDELNFSIEQVWYKKGWMFFVYLSIAAIIGFILYQIHLRRLKKERQVLEAERERALREQEVRSNNEKLSLELVNKSKELANSTMGLIRKNETLQNVKSELIKVRKDKPERFSGRDFQRIIHLIDVQITSEHDWEIFETNFNQVHEHFFKKLKKEFPDLTPGDLKLAAYLKMNLSSKEIAPLLNISIRGVENKRYRLRKKIGLPAPENLTEYMIRY
ncbi:MAG: hypothetical protein DWQ02_19085 [Bacteroidetes bacterium]|nr:MAG: hypothetical protein DWQ02_19085 [Bacteroidota bacterium]